MTDKNFEALYKNSKEIEPRQELKDEILARAYKELEASSNTTEAKKKPSPYKTLKLWIPIAACLMLAVLVLGSAFGLKNEKYQTIYIDVNPSVEIYLNRFERVSGVEFLNDDAKKALSGIKLKGLSPEEALESVVTSYDAHGYFGSEAELYISAIDKNDKSAKLIERLQGHAEKIKGEKKYNVNTCKLTKEDKQAASEAGISAGKYRVISQIIELDSSYTIEDLKDKSMSELERLKKSLNK